MRGRKPKPVEQRVREGNTEKRPLPEPVLVGGRPSREELIEPPEEMSADGKEAWRTIVPSLFEVGLLDRVDRLALEAMCTQYARAKQAGRVIKKAGTISRGSTGQLREHPAVAVERNAHQMFLRYAEQYALTPTARTRLGLAELHRRSLAEELREGTPSVNLQPVED